MTVHQHTPNSSATFDNRPGELTHLPARLGARSPGQHDLRVEVLGALRPGLAFTQRRPTAPPPLAPDQPCGTTEAGQISNGDLDAVVRLGARATVLAADHGGRRLDPDDELVGCLAHRQHPEPIESQQRLSQASTVAHRQGSFSSSP
jgi:hypothetical protein